MRLKNTATDRTKPNATSVALTYARLAAIFFTVILSPITIANALAQTLTVTSYNLKNAFDVYDDPYTGDETTAVKPRAEIEAIARQIAATAGDVVAFQELENEAILREMVARMLPDSGYKYIAVMPTNSTRGINLGIISRYPIVTLTSHRFMEFGHDNDPAVYRFARDLLKATIRVPYGDEPRDATEPIDPEPGQLVDLYIVHLKSRRTVGNDKNSVRWRTAEAKQVVKIIAADLEDNPNQNVLLVGDMNTNLDNDTYGILAGSPLLTDVHDGQPIADRITYPSTRYPNSVLDYIFASPSMAERFLPGSARVIKTEDAFGSDHLPIVASFDMAQ